MEQVIVIGGGAAGMIAAIAAAENGRAVTLLEKNEKLGKKLYITGKGRCNVTNACDWQTFFDNIVSNPKFLYSSFGSWNNQDMMDWLQAKGLRLKVERGNRVFPLSDKSSDVIRTLQRELERLKVQVRLRTEVESLLLTKEEEMCRLNVSRGKEGETCVREGSGSRGNAARCLGVRLSSGEECRAEAVIVATGGLSYPTTGSTGDGYRFARQARLKVTETYPALVPLEAVFADGRPVKELQGLSLKNITASLFQGNQLLTGEFGEMLFTHFGVSGPVLLSASSRITKQLQKGPLRLEIDWKPALTPEQLDARLLREFEAGRNKQLKNVMGSLLPATAIPAMLRAAAISSEKPIHEITREARARLVQTLKHFPLKVTGVRGYAEAIITQGGVSVRELSPATMESKKVKGLFFAGEVLDVDALTGGYNLQIAWSTGYAAGKGV